MRVLHIVPSLNPFYGGPARSVPMLCRGLANAGLDVTLYATSAGPKGKGGLPDRGEIRCDGYRIRFFPMRWRGPASMSMPLLCAVRAARA